jgi:hypothetical protein
MAWSKDRVRIGFGSEVPGIALLFVVTFGFLLLAVSPAFAAGGACPTGANYGNSFNQTLSGIGVTSCYFVSKSLGADTNSGTSESSPWAHVPGMYGCAGNCAALTPTAGEGFIMRGGDMWLNADLGVYWAPTWAGTSSHPMYIGVDPSWFAGSSWTRPIWNVQGQGIGAYPGNCAILCDWANYTIFDNIEIKGMGTSGGSGGTIVQAYGAQYASFQRLYIHGWSHAASGDWDNGNVYVAGNGAVGTCLHDSVIDGSDTTQDMLAALFSTVPCAYNNYIGFVTNGMEATGSNIHDNTFGPIVTPFSGITHQNHLFHFGPDNGATNQFIYNNVISVTKLGGASGGAVSQWINGNESNSATAYAFNNVIYDVGSGNVVNTGPHSGAAGTMVVFNNTVECGSDSNLCGGGGNAQAGPSGAISWTNDYWINSNGVPPLYCYTTYSPCTNSNELTQTLSTANGQGYTSTSTYAFQPTSSNGSTVGKGANLTSTCSAISNSSAEVAAWATAAGAACQNDTTYGVTYNTTNHTVSLARVPNARGTSGSWDAGAYQYSAGNQQPNPPTGLTAVVQ